MNVYRSDSHDHATEILKTKTKATKIKADMPSEGAAKVIQISPAFPTPR